MIAIYYQISPEKSSVFYPTGGNLNQYLLQKYICFIILSMAKFAVIIFVVTLLTRLFGLNAAGNTWDEYFYYNASRDFAVNLSNRDFNSDKWKSNFEHPPVGKYVYVPAMIWNKYAKPSVADSYRAPRVISAIIGSLTVVMVYLIGARFISQKTGLIATLIYGLLPPVIAYHKIINLDVTMVFFFTASIAAFLECLRSKNEKWLWVSVILGSLAIATKFNAVFLVIPIYGTLILKKRNLQLPNALILFPLLALGTLFLTWPWLWGQAADHFSQTLRHWGGAINENFLGQIGQAPIYYFLVHFGVGIPLLVIALMTLGIFKLAKPAKTLTYVLLLWLAAPFLFSFSHLRQDHIRYILPALPAASLIAAIGFQKLPFQKIAVVILVAYLVFVNARIYPYFLNYYNEIVGGPAGVYSKKLFALGFYGEGIKEATEYVNKIATDGQTVHFEVIPDDVPYLDRPRLTRLDQSGADYLIINSNALSDPKKRSFIDTAGYQEIYAVKANGAPFVWVYTKIKN